MNSIWTCTECGEDIGRVGIGYVECWCCNTKYLIKLESDGDHIYPTVTKVEENDKW